MRETEINKIIFERISNIEDNLEEINVNLQILLEEKEDNRNEQLLLMTRFENLADFIKNQYNIVIEENEQYLSEDLENEN